MGLVDLFLLLYSMNFSLPFVIKSLTSLYRSHMSIFLGFGTKDSPLLSSFICLSDSFVSLFSIITSFCLLYGSLNKYSFKELLMHICLFVL